MTKYFFNLYFQYNENVEQEEFSSVFNLGYFSSYKKAKETIQLYAGKPGFKEFDEQCFKIQKFGVKFDNENIDKTKVILYELSHVFTDSDGITEEILFGVYSTMLMAKAMLTKQKKKRSFKGKTEGFHIAKWRVDVDLAWEEGFDSDNQ